MHCVNLFKFFCPRPRICAFWRWQTAFHHCSRNECCYTHVHVRWSMYGFFFVMSISYTNSVCLLLIVLSAMAVFRINIHFYKMIKMLSDKWLELNEVMTHGISVCIGKSMIDEVVWMIALQSNLGLNSFMVAWFRSNCLCQTGEAFPFIYVIQI